MAIYVKGRDTKTNDYTLFVDAAASLTGPTLATVDDGTIVCKAGSTAYTLAGVVYILSTAGVWTEVV